MVQHIGYFNDPQDIKELMDKDAKSIVKYYKKNQETCGPPVTRTMPLSRVVAR